MEINGFPAYTIDKEGLILGKWKRPIKSRIVAGYKVVNLYTGPKEFKTVKVHRLLATTFIPNPENLPFVDHINQDKLDNRIENLRWASMETNAQNRPNVKGVCYCKSTKWYNAYLRMDGVRHQKVFKTQKEAEDWLAQKRQELNHPLS